MSTHNICFRQEIRKILCGYPFLSVAMTNSVLFCANPTSLNDLMVKVTVKISMLKF